MEDPLITGAKSEFPVLRDMGLGYKYNPGAQPSFLEFWPADEPGAPEYPRPKEFPPGTIGVEVYDPNTRPIDIMGDVASHHLVKSDRTMKSYYRKFEESLTPWQKKQLERQYDHAVRQEGEKRPYQDWYEHSGLPGYFRGYAFQQWEKPEELYTKPQLRMFDQMMKYLRGKE